MVDEVDAKGLAICEVGARNVSPGATSKRSLFPRASAYIGTDVHMADNFDLAGDAHYLDELIGVASVDAVFSIAVMEHLSFPVDFCRRGQASASARRADVPSYAPLLAPPPNDFWRFSDNALRLLFGPETGFETVYAGMHNRTHFYPEERREAFSTLPLAVAYSHVFVLARKVRDIDPEAVRWPVAKQAAGELASQYPLPRADPNVPNRTSAV